MADARRAYRVAGVDVDAGSRAVDLIRAHVESTRRVEVLGGLGGFGGAFTVPAGYREPVLVASTDGVGTKTAIAAGIGRFDTIGIDLVAMCVDDVPTAAVAPAPAAIGGTVAPRRSGLMTVSGPLFARTFAASPGGTGEVTEEPDWSTGSAILSGHFSQAFKARGTRCFVVTGAPSFGFGQTRG